VIYSLKQTLFGITPACSGALLNADEEKGGVGPRKNAARLLHAETRRE